MPLAITALTSQDIENKGIRNLDDVAANTPGLTFSNLQGAFLPSPVIRGMAPINVNGENNVGIFIDGVFVSGREGLNFSQLDVERIEIIKGPQAALYGRNTFSGAINYVTAKPTDVFQGKTEITVGTDNRFLAAASASGPLIEGTLKGRIAASIDTYDGAYDNSYSGIGQGADIGGYEYRTGQASLLWTPNDIFEGELSLYVSRDQVDTPPQLPVAANCEDRHDVDPSKSSRLQNFCGTFQSIDRDSISVIPQAVGEDRKLNRAQLRLNWDTDIGTITSQSGYSALKHSGYIDGSRGEGENVIFSYLGTQVAMAPPFNTYQLGQLQTGLLQIQPQTTVEEVSEELRFESPADRDFRYSTGLYAFRTKMRGGDRGVIATKPLPADFTSFCLACAFVGSGYTDFAPGGGDATFLPWFTNPPLGDTVPDKINHSEDKAYAVFASAEWDFIENWTGRIEGRYTRTKKDFDNTATGASGDDSWNTTDWRATLDYKPADNITVYGSIAHAEKSGGFDENRQFPERADGGRNHPRCLRPGEEHHLRARAEIRVSGQAAAF
ncbi:MAG: TonB-dependent receptor [Gammaproteobacteria bacterium]